MVGPNLKSGVLEGGGGIGMGGLCWYYVGCHGGERVGEGVV